MKNKKIRQGLSGLLCAALLSQPLAASAGWYWSDGTENLTEEQREAYYETYGAPEMPGEAANFFGLQDEAVPSAAMPAAVPSVSLHSGTAVIPAGASLDEVKRILAEALIGPGADGSNLNWEYYCEGQTKIGTWGNKSWGSIDGFTTKTGKIIKTQYEHPALADNGDGTYQVRIKDGNQEAALTKKSALDSSISVQNATVTIPVDANGNTDFDALRAAIFQQVVTGTEPGMTVGDVTIEYYATKKAVLNFAGWVSLEGGKIPDTAAGATKADADPISAGTHQIRISYAGNGTYSATSAEAAVTLEVPTIPDGQIVLNQGPFSVPMTYDVNGSIDYAAAEQAILAAVVAGTDPAGVPVTVEYDAKNFSVGGLGDPNWKPLSHTPGTLDNTKAFGEGPQTIRFSLAGTNEYKGTSVTAAVEMTGRTEAPITFTPAEAKLTYVQNEDGSITVSNLDALVESICGMFSCESGTVDLSGAALEYYAEAKSGSVGSIGKNWVPLRGGKVSGLEYPAISEGVWQVRLVWGGNTQYAPTTVNGTVTVTGREAIQYTLKDAPYEVGMVFTAGQGYDYAATIRAIYDAVVDSTNPAADYEAVKMEYTTTADVGGVNFKPLDHQGATGLLDFKEGTWRIRITWPETVDYRAASATVEVTVTDSRIASAVVLREGASFTYNMDYAVMERAIFENAIDWENSTLPEGADLSDFDIKYKAQLDVLDDSVDAGKLGSLIGKIPGLENIGGGIGDIAGSLGESTKTWMPISGGKNAVGVPYAPMGAGEHKVQITFKGSAEYKPSEAAEGSVTVKKANVKVKVNSTNIRAGQPLPANFITTDPDGKFEFYTIYAGATSNVNLGLYLDLPAKYTGSKLLKILDPVVERIAGKSFTAMLNEGVTLGALRKLVTNTELIDLLEKVGVDTGAFGQIIKVVNALPSITDGVRVGFGVPKNQAGLYTVTVITDNRNYNTGVGVGALLVRMNLKGVKLTWNQDLGKQISAADAKEFDFGATLSFDGDVTISQSSVHYLYSGFTSKWKPYSSTTKAPTEPGRYTMTVVTLGGSYQAAPITRSFQITK